ncbi:protein kinase [Solihabitans fulvus]|uniref:non-specific serine/threonine protein kinase n=1 Tax=Solihabitans fulvus TaxID=1892852 RepID=A0A5B2XMP7_9PSEU|nr:serine/threonine-protein kinase [Solihabitans fulvus]KAA2264656.1 protein kinase [Solihabitans fulvus]
MANDGDLIARRYRLVSRIGSGAMGVVWQAEDERLRRTVAVKELLVHAGMSPAQTEEAHRRAVREGRLAARLHHPNAIAVYDAVEHEGKPCLIMEYVPSLSLSATLADRGALPVHEVAAIGAQIASALAAAHKAGIVHRDVKPGNVLMAADGTAKLTDFGISRATGDGTLTATGMLAGTPAYLAPEVAQGHDASFASDLYSLGATLYAAVEGAPPFGFSDNAIALLYRIATSDAPKPERAGELTATLDWLLQRDPAARPTATDAKQVLEALAELADPPQAAAVSTPPVAAEQPTVQAPVVLDPVGPTPTEPDRSAIEPLPAGTEPPHTRRRAVVAALVTAVLVVTGVVVYALNSGSRNDAGSGVSVQNSATTSASGQSPAPSAATGTTAGTGAPANPAPSTAPPTSATSAAPPTQDLATQLTSAITDYYRIVPGDLDQGWGLMTTDYQQNHAGGRAGYQGFWRPIDHVTVSDVVATPPSSVVATIGYVYKDGHTESERTTYGLVNEGGVWKIASSVVGNRGN